MTNFTTTDYQSFLAKNLKNYKHISKHVPHLVHQMAFIMFVEDFLKNNPTSIDSLNLVKELDKQHSAWKVRKASADQNVFDKYDLIFDPNNLAKKSAQDYFPYIKGEVIKPNVGNSQKKLSLAADFGLVRNKDHSVNLGGKFYLKKTEITPLFFQMKDELFSQIQNELNKKPYDYSKYRRLMFEQTSLFTDHRTDFRRFYVLEVLYLLKELKMDRVYEFEIPALLFFSDVNEIKMKDKISPVYDLIMKLRAGTLGNQQIFEDNLKTFLSDPLFANESNDFYDTAYHSDQRIYNFFRDNLNVDYNLPLAVNTKDKYIYLNTKSNIKLSDCFIDEVLNSNSGSFYDEIFTLDDAKFQTYLCKEKDYNQTLINNPMDIEMTSTMSTPNLDQSTEFKLNLTNEIDGYDFSKEFNEDIFKLDSLKLDPSNQDNTNTYTNAPIRNIILFGNPNSGKTEYIKTYLPAHFEKNNIKFHHNEIYVSKDDPLPFGRFFAYEDNNSNLIVSSYYKTVVSAIKNFRTPHVNFFDEMGEQDFKKTFGQLKSIFKNTNRVDLEKIYKDFPCESSKNHFITSLKSISSIESLNRFISDYKKEIGGSNIVTITIGKRDLLFFMPTNYLFIGTSNYAPTIRKSLTEDNYAFGEKGDRFKSIHFIEGINGYNFFEDGIVQQTIISFNKKLLGIFEDKDVLSKLDDTTKTNFAEFKYQFLISNFYIPNKDVSSNELIDAAKDYLIKCFDKEEIQPIIDEIEKQ